MDDIYMYHITKKSNLNKILSQGLLVNSNNNGFVKKTYLHNYYIKYGLQPIFLTTDVDFLIKTQLTNNFYKSCVILKVNVSSLKLEDEYDYLNQKWYLYYKTKNDMFENISQFLNKTFICKDNIEPDLIYIVDLN